MLTGGTWSYYDVDKPIPYRELFGWLVCGFYLEETIILLIHIQNFTDNAFSDVEF